MEITTISQDASTKAEFVHPFASDVSHVSHKEIKGPKDMLDMVSGVVCYRIENPKPMELPRHKPSKKAIATAKCKKDLSLQDKQDIKSACALAISQLGSWENQIIPWRDCFNYSRQAIGLTRDAENHRCTIRLDGFSSDENGKKTRIVETIESPFPLSILSPIADLERDAMRRENLALKIRELRTACFAYSKSDLSRKKKSALKSHLATIREISRRTLRHRGMSENEIKAICMKIARFNEYVKLGKAVIASKRIQSGPWMPLAAL
jgi:hypothetical protein